MKPPTSPGLPPALAVRLYPKSCRTVRFSETVARLLQPSQPGSLSNRSVRCSAIVHGATHETRTAAPQRNRVRRAIMVLPSTPENSVKKFYAGKLPLARGCGEIRHVLNVGELSILLDGIELW